MGKSRKAVSVALHTELSEYASLLRALRTSDTLDLSSQLTKAQPRASASQNAHEADEDGGEGGISLSATASRDITPGVRSSSKSKGSPKRSFSEKARNKDNWTRWPLLEGDVHTPEFGFEDEIEAIASEALKLQRQEDPEGENHPPEEEDEDARLPQPFLDSLTLASSTHLSQILSALAAHVPLAEMSMQNRIKPIGWEGVLDIVAVSGLADPKLIEDVQHRMERMYDSSDRYSVSRAQSSFSAKRTLDDLVAMHDMSFLAVPEPPPMQVPRGRRRRAKKS